MANYVLSRELPCRGVSIENKGDATGHVLSPLGPQEVPIPSQAVRRAVVTGSVPYPTLRKRVANTTPATPAGLSPLTWEHRESSEESERTHVLPRSSTRPLGSITGGLSPEFFQTLTGYQILFFNLFFSFFPQIT